MKDKNYKLRYTLFQTTMYSDYLKGIFKSKETAIEYAKSLSDAPQNSIERYKGRDWSDFYRIDEIVMELISTDIGITISTPKE